MFKKILIANRGEIAVRIIRACNEMGIQTVAVYSQADKKALHVQLADESYCIGGPYLKDSYLNMSAIIVAAVNTGCQAIHPGYGLLSENPQFAELCEKCHIKFIGPNYNIIAKMGDKDEARRTMQKAGVPVVPGMDEIVDIAEAKAFAKKIGFPIIVKASAGGGGRGIRIVQTEEEFEQAVLTAKMEAKNAFGNDKVYLEKYLTDVKHVEMQILADEHGNVVVLGERDCSMQRKNQKIIEESPCKVLKPKVRQAMIDATVLAAKYVGYTNAGTIEYLLDKDENFYFMEMNTRLQVEHPVTECVTEIDLVKWQIRIASGQPFLYKQEDIVFRGAAIECRINAEDVTNDFKPNCGKIKMLHTPGGAWVRFDSAIYQGYEIPPFYDSMIGKLIVYARDREEAIRKMKSALSELKTEGVITNVEFSATLLAQKEFEDGSYCTNFLEKYLKGQATKK